MQILNNLCIHQQTFLKLSTPIKYHFCIQFEEMLCISTHALHISIRALHYNASNNLFETPMHLASPMYHTLNGSLSVPSDLNHVHAFSFTSWAIWDVVISSCWKIIWFLLVHTTHTIAHQITFHLAFDFVHSPIIMCWKKFCFAVSCNPTDDISFAMLASAFRDQSSTKKTAFDGRKELSWRGRGELSWHRREMELRLLKRWHNESLTKMNILVLHVTMHVSIETSN